MGLRRIKEVLITLLVFLGVYTIYINSGNAFQFDSRWTIPTSMSIIKQGNTDLDEYQSLIDQSADAKSMIQNFNGHLYANYPASISLLVAPLVFAADQIARWVYSFDLAAYVHNTFPAALEMLIASFITALIVVLIFRIARLFLKTGTALVLTCIFAFGTAAWSVTSRALWRHGPSMFMLAIALYLILLARKRPWLIQFVSLPLAFAFTIRGHNILSLVFITLFVLLKYRSYFLRYLLWILPVGVPFVLYNLSIYQAPASSYYSIYQPLTSSHASLLEGLAANLISPSRGLLVFSPILVLAIAGVVLKIKRRTFDKLDAALISVILLHWLIISDWEVWWGGWSFGSRFFADVLPYWIYLMIPVFAAIPSLVRPRKLALVSITAILAGFSFFVHYRGANAPETVLQWSTWPVNIDDMPSRVWDWNDVQFLRGLKWGTPVDLILAGVPVQQLDKATYTLLGTNDFRTRKFTATGSLIAPTSQAWLAIANNQPIGPELAALFDGISPKANLRSIGNEIPYRLYHFDLGKRLLEAARQSEQVARWGPGLYPAPVDIHTVPLPIQFGQTAQLIGFETITDSVPGHVTVVTYWQASDQITTTLMLFVHAINANGQLVAGGDGLDAPTRYWQTGDLIAQINRLSLPPNAGRVWIELGLYDPDSGKRQPVLINEQEIDQRLLLQSIDSK